MYVEQTTASCLDPSSQQGGITAENGFSQAHHITPTSFSMEELSYQQNHPQGDPSAAAAMDIELQQQLGVNLEACYSNSQSVTTTHLMKDPNEILASDQSNWEASIHDIHQDMNFSHYHNQQEQHLHQMEIPNNGLHHHNSFSSVSSLQESTPPYPPTPDLLNLFHLPRCSASQFLPNSSLSFVNPAADGGSGSTVLYDPLLPLNLPPQPPLFRDLIHSLPHSYGLPGARSGSLFGGLDERDGNGSGLHNDGDGGHFDTGVLEFSSDITCLAKGRYVKDTKHFATERQRRQHLNGKYAALRSLVPNPTKVDRASVVGDAIEYIKELLRTVDELKLLVEKKRCGRERIKEQQQLLRNEGDSSSAVDAETTDSTKPPHTNVDPDQQQAYNNVSSSSLRTSWLQRKSKSAEVDVRIIDDEVTIKLVQQKRINCLLLVSKVLDDLQLDLHHVAGGLIGDYYSFLFNTKICEGSSVYASAIASKLIEVVDRQYAAAIPPTNNY